jgi:hypothetical protein
MLRLLDGTEGLIMHRDTLPFYIVIFIIRK